MPIGYTDGHCCLTVFIKLLPNRVCYKGFLYYQVAALPEMD